ncbi:hypothetical protein RclHR1_00050038 [Rhizophagus clarus]|uniref:Uncharacterized protein n=1 Tax=Rhizophagus clarus TaxID=94130 RepID=A0A2Z6S1Y5_9GLOM|nr:hypothetical protein RclHR1_00050038 [Rhizophagus clarus]
MVDKYDPTTDIHNLFVFAMVPLLIHASLSFNYEGFMGSKYLFAVVELITFAIYTVLPTVFYSYHSNFFEIFGKTRFIMTYFALPVLLINVIIIIVIFVMPQKESESLENFMVRLLICGFVPFTITDFVVNVYYYSYFCNMTFKSYDYLYLVIPLSCICFLGLLSYIYTSLTSKVSDGLTFSMDITALFLICFILKVFVITTLISTSTIVTNSILAIFAFPVYYCYHDIKDRLSSPSPPSPPPSYSQENFDSFVDKLVTKSSFDYTLYKDDYWKQKFPDNDGDIRKYYDFGKAFEDRLKELKKSDIKERLARALVYEEILAPYDMDQKITIEKELFIAQRIYEFFNEIGEDKIQETSLTAKEICDIDINYILSHLTERHIKKIREKKQMIQEEDQEGKDQEKEKGQAMVIEMEEKAK